MRVSFLEIADERVTGVISGARGRKVVEIKEDKQGLVHYSNCQSTTIEHLDEFEGLNLDFQNYRDSFHKNQSKSHFLTSIVLEVFNNKTQEDYCSKLNIVSVNGRGEDLPVLTKTLSALSHRETYVRYHESKLTHLIKDTLPPPCSP